MAGEQYQITDYLNRRKKLKGILFETALPNEYLVRIGTKEIKPVIGGRSIRLFRRYMRIPASVQTLYFTTDNANVDYQGIGLDGYASWRIDPSNPVLAIRTLDFFDENDPMARTNNELRTICIEAVRHVISNMTIDEALKKKEDIANNLKDQLKEIESKWGLIFDQVGIEKVRIMSNKVFEGMQSQFRDRLRLEASRTRINTDMEITNEENNMRETTKLKALDTDKKVNLIEVDNKNRVREAELTEQQNISRKEREISEDEYRRDILFKIEQEEKNYELSLLAKTKETSLLSTEEGLLQARKKIEELLNEMNKNKLEVEKLTREIQQIYSSDSLISSFIETLPRIYESIHIKNYSVMDAGQNSGVSPVTRVLNELIFALKSSDLKWMLEKKTDKQAE